MEKVTVLHYKGLAIQINTSNPHDGYSIDHPDFKDHAFSLLQYAVDAIDARVAQAREDYA